MKICSAQIDTPIGTLIAASTSDGVCVLDFADVPKCEAKLARIKQLSNVDIVDSPNNIIEELKTQLEEYFAGKLKEFTIPIDILYGTKLQRIIWDTLLTIKYGECITYAHLSNAVNKPKAVRAVANAVGWNPISILLPCHRVIGSDGSLTGYSGGLERKKFLLKLEEENIKLK